MNWRMLLVLTFALGILIPFAGCTSDDDDDPPPPPPPEFGPSMIAVGDNGNILVSGNTSTWTVVTATGSLATLDLDEVVMVPGHASRRLVTFGDDSGATADAEIWYSDDGGATWTQATITELTGVRAATTYDINDIHFMNALEGVAVGTEGLILFTLDAGANWTEMNVWSDTGLAVNPGDLEIWWNVVTPNTSGNPVQGTTLTQGQGATPLVDYVTADVVCWDVENEYTILTNVQTFGAATAFNTTDTVTWGTDGTGDFWSITTDDVWRYDFVTANCVYGVETAGTGSDTTLTIWFANDNGARYECIWKIVSSAAVPGAARTWTWTTPSETFQASATASDVSYDDIHRFFFFDDMTGVAARRINGIMQTEDGGVTWTHNTTTDISAFNEYWSEFWYDNNGGTGWLYSLENDGYVARVGIVYSATATPPYQFDTTPNDWEILDGSGTYNSAEVDDHTGVVAWNNHAYIIAVDSFGDWTYGDRFGQALMDNDIFSDPGDMYRGGVMAMGSNPAYNKDIEDASSTSYQLNHWTRR